MITVIAWKYTRCNPLALLDITLKAALCSEKISQCHYPLSSKPNFSICLRFAYSLAESRPSLFVCLFCLFCLFGSLFAFFLAES